MKHILPILTITTLAAAASAQNASAQSAAATSGFNYNTVTVAYSSEDFSDAADNIQLTSITLSHKLSKNIFGTVGLINGSETNDQSDLQGLSLGLGYVYTVNANLDIVATWSQSIMQTSITDSQNINVANYEVGVRYNFGSGIELNASIGRNNYIHEDSATNTADSGVFRTGYSVGASYKVNNDFTVNAKATWNKGNSADLADSSAYTLGVSYNY